MAKSPKQKLIADPLFAELRARRQIANARSAAPARPEPVAQPYFEKMLENG